MSISTDFGDAQQWAQTHFGGVGGRAPQSAGGAAGGGLGTGAEGEYSAPEPGAGLCQQSRLPVAGPRAGHPECVAGASPPARGPATTGPRHVPTGRGHRGAELALRAPQRPSGATYTGAPASSGLVRVWEDIGPDATGPDLEWLLLCDQPVTDFAQALICARQYTSRWLIEDFHKALKTGLGAEKLQLQTANRLFAAVALLSVVALALVDLREKNRLQPDLPAEAAYYVIGLTDFIARIDAA